MVTLRIELTCTDSNDPQEIKEAAVMRLEGLGEVKLLACELWTPQQLLMEAMEARKGARK